MASAGALSRYCKSAALLFQTTGSVPGTLPVPGSQLLPGSALLDQPALKFSWHKLCCHARKAQSALDKLPGSADIVHERSCVQPVMGVQACATGTQALFGPHQAAWCAYDNQSALTAACAACSGGASCRALRAQSLAVWASPFKAPLLPRTAMAATGTTRMCWRLQDRVQGKRRTHSPRQACLGWQAAAAQQPHRCAVAT